MSRKIIIGYDGSPSSRDALALGSYLAPATQSELVIASVFPDEPLASHQRPGPYEATRRRDARSALAGARAQLEESLADSRFCVSPGTSAARSLHGLAEVEEADLVLVGSSHRGKAGRVLIGSTAQRLLHGSPCAVGVAPAGYRYHRTSEAPRIGVAFDAGPEAQEALATAEALARDLEGIVRIMTVLDIVPPHSGMGSGYEQHTLDRRDRATELMSRAAGRAGTVRPVETELREGAPASELLASTSELDLLCLGSRGYGPARRALIGSVSQAVMAGATCPVIVVPRGVQVTSAERDEDRELAFG